MYQDSDEVVLIDESGEKVRFQHILTFLHEGERYIALSPLSASEEDGEEQDVIILRVEDRGGEDAYVPVENDVLLEEVFDTFLACMEEIEENRDGNG